MRAPVLLFCPDAWTTFVGNSIMGFTRIRDWRDFKALAQLDKPATFDGYHRFLVAATDEEMRGVDLRSPIKGVTLVIAQSFSCQRNADQGLMRVCRYGDPGRRVMAMETSLVDGKKAAAISKKLFTFASKHKPKQKAAIDPSTLATAEFYSKGLEKLQEKEMKRTR